MAFDAATLQHLEDALSEAFRFHAALDAFLTRCGVPAALMKAVRDEAEARSASSGRYTQAPKRFVAQGMIGQLGTLGDDGDRIVAAMVTGLIRMPLPDATPAGAAAVEALREKMQDDRATKAEEREAAKRAAAASARAGERAREAARAARTAARDDLQKRFIGLMQEANAQARGYLFETFLNDLFAFEGLDPRRSFKLVGEQIDGSFAWRDRTYLVEAKWTQTPAAGAEFGAFSFKLDGKTADTRGLFVSVNGYSSQAISAMNGKGQLKFVCIDGTHLMRALSSDDGLTQLLERVWRHADETGEAYLPASYLQDAGR